MWDKGRAQHFCSRVGYELIKVKYVCVIAARAISNVARPQMRAYAYQTVRTRAENNERTTNNVWM